MYNNVSPLKILLNFFFLSFDTIFQKSFHANILSKEEPTKNARSVHQELMDIM